MRIHRKERKPVEQDVVVESAAVCDLCARRQDHGGRTSVYDLGVNWTRTGHDVDEVTIGHRWGSHYPEGDFTQAVFTDCCGACFRDKVRPALEALGCKFSTVESDP